MIDIKEKIYILLCAMFIALVLVGNMIYQKFVYLPIFGIYTFQISAGAILYPLTFLVSDLIIEFYGTNRAKFCLRLSILISFFISIMIYSIAGLKAVPWSKVDDELFKLVFGHFGIAFAASIFTSYISQSIDIYVYSLLKKLTTNKYLWLRNNLSSAISLFIDTALITVLLALFGILPKEQIDNLIFNSYLFKVLFTICITPLFYLAHYLIEQKTKIISQ
ncbi:MAG: VUT family protein [Rickettsiaceae bacterium]|nr:MAG: VUT family protein [Rickettsiaceae bacterium]